MLDAGCWDLDVDGVEGGQGCLDGAQVGTPGSLEAQWQLYSAQWWQPVRVRACTARKVHAAAARSPLPSEPTDGEATDC